MGYLRYSDALTDKFYNSDSVVILSRTCHERAYDEMLISLQPLSVLPFQLGLEYVLENSKHLTHSPNLSPNRNKSPLISPSLEKEVVIPPPKPARSIGVNGTGLISAKAWEWIKGSVCEEAGDQKSTEVDQKVVEKKEEVSSGLSENRSKSSDDMQGRKVQKQGEGGLPVIKKSVSSGGSQPDVRGMTDSFSGIAQKLLGMNTSREKSPENSVNKTQTANSIEKKAVKDKVQPADSTETVSSKAKSGILKFFDKLLLSKDNVASPKSQIPKRYSWNVPSEGQSSSGSSATKSLSPVSGNKELKNSLEYQKQKFANQRKTQKSKSESVVAKSIQSEATKDDGKAAKDDGKTVVGKSEGNSNGKSLRATEKVNATSDKLGSKMARNPPSNLSLKMRIVEEAQEKAPVKVSDSPSKKFGSPQRRAADKAKISKIPTLQKKAESKIPKRNSLVLDSSGYSSSSVLSSPTRVKHSYSAGQIPVPVQSPKKTKTYNATTEAETSTKKTASLKTVVSKSEVEKLEGMASSTEFPSQDPTESVESNTSSECASLEVGPTLVAPSQTKKKQKGSVETQSGAVESEQMGRPPPVFPGTAAAAELDINSNSSHPQPCPSEEVWGQSAERGTCEAGHHKDFMKPDFR